MNKVYKSFAVLMIVIALGAGYFIMCSQDTQQTLKRKGVEYFDGDYDVTVSLSYQQLIKFKVRNGKITSKTKSGYYFFWDQNGRYIQSPIGRTLIVEYKEK